MYVSKCQFAIRVKSHEIAVLKSILENEGIPYFFENETIVSIDPFASIAYGGIKDEEIKEAIDDRSKD